MHAELYHVTPIIFIEVKINQLSYFQEIASKGYFLPKPLFILPPLYEDLLLGSDLNDWGTRNLGNQLKAFPVYLLSISPAPSSCLPAPGLKYSKLKGAFSVDCFRLHNCDWLKKMGVQEKMPNPSLHIDFEPHSQGKRRVLRRLCFFSTIPC